MSEPVEMSRGNIFADIGDPEPDRTLARAQVMHRIASIIEERDLTQAKAAKLLGISQARVSKLVNGKLDQFSLDQLLTLLNRLDRDVEILIKPKPEERPLSFLSLFPCSARGLLFLPFLSGSLTKKLKS